MARIATLVGSTGVGSYHVGIKDLGGYEQRATFQFDCNSPFFAEVLATNNFDFVTNVGSNWINVTDRIFKDQGQDDPDFVQVSGSRQYRRAAKAGNIVAAGIYAMDAGFFPAAFQVNVTSVTSGDPLGIFFGV